MSDKARRDLTFLNTLLHDMATGAEDVLEDEAAVDELLNFARSAMAEQRRKRLEVARAQRLAKRSSGRIRNYAQLGRQQILEMIEGLRQSFPGIAVQHRELEGMPMEDLRSLYEDLEALVEPDGSDGEP